MSTITHSVRFDKYHGTGNDFIVVDATDPVPDRPAFARRHCNRERGVRGADFDAASRRRGADGVLFLALEERYRPARVVMTLVQPDGSVAPTCGNGARVAARWAHERTGATEFMIDTPAGTSHALVEDDIVTTEMGRPSFAPRDVGLDRAEPLVEEVVAGLTVTAVYTGVPHAVAFVDDVDAVALDAVAPAVRHADVFDRGANVTLASRDGDGFRQRTFERGVEGETQSCGTGAVAVVAVAERLGLVSARDDVRVSPPGGDLSVRIPGRGPATLTGAVEWEFAGELDPVRVTNRND